jgi:hypothetical protein
MPGLDPGIHEFQLAKKNVDGRDKPGHDEIRCRGSDLRGVLVSAAFLFSSVPWRKYIKGRAGEWLSLA